MEQYNGQSIAINDQGAVVDIGSPGKWYTMHVASGASNIYYRGRTGSEAALNDAADAAALRALGCSEIQPGEPVAVFGGQAEVVCINAETATLVIDAGMKISTIEAALTIGTVNSDLDSIGGTTVNVSSGNIDNGTQVVNQATNGVNATAFGTIGVAAAVNGAIHPQLRYIGEQLDNLETLLGVGTGAMASAQAVTLATDDTQLGTTSSASSVTGDIHGKLRYIGTQLEANLAALITAGGGGYVRQDSTATIAKESGGNLASILAVLNGTAASLTEKAPTWVIREIATAGTAVRFAAADNTYATYVGVEAKKTGGANTGNIYIGDSNVSGIATLAQYHPVGVGGTWEYRAAPGTKFDLYDLFFDCETGNTDGIIYVYAPA